MNGTRALIAAGYSPGGASACASRLLASDKVQAEIARRRAKMSEQSAISREWVLKTIEEAVERAMQHRPVIDSSGKPVMVTTPDGETAAAYTFNAMAAMRGAELAGKHLGMFQEAQKTDTEQLTADPTAHRILRQIAASIGPRAVQVLDHQGETDGREGVPVVRDDIRRPRAVVPPMPAESDAEEGTG